MESKFFSIGLGVVVAMFLLPHITKGQELQRELNAKRDNLSRTHIVQTTTSSSLQFSFSEYEPSVDLMENIPIENYTRLQVEQEIASQAALKLQIKQQLKRTINDTTSKKIVKRSRASKNTKKEEEQIISEKPTISKIDIEKKEYDFSEDDKQLLAQLAEAEAGNQGYKGIVDVLYVVLHRVESEEFPDTIYDVIYQKNQFETVSNGTINNDPSKLCKKAVEDIENGEAEDEYKTTLYFDSCNGDSWAGRNRQYCATYKNHDFYY